MTEKTEKKAATRRLYLVRDAKGDDRLVNATGAAQAIAHVYEPECRPATAIEAATMVQAGARIELAGATAKKPDILDAAA